MTTRFPRLTLGALLLVFSANPLVAGEEPAQPKAPAAPSSKGKATPSTTRRKGKLKPVDLNNATTEALSFMLGIDLALAKKIVAARPYRSKADLVTRGVLSQATYNTLKDKVMVDAVKPASK